MYVDNIIRAVFFYYGGSVNIVIVIYYKSWFEIRFWLICFMLRSSTQCTKEKFNFDPK